LSLKKPTKVNSCTLSSKPTTSTSVETNNGKDTSSTHSCISSQNNNPIEKIINPDTVQTSQSDDIIIIDDLQDLESSQDSQSSQASQSSQDSQSSSSLIKPLSKKALKKRKIRVLESKLEKLEKQINRLSEVELTFHDMESEESAYLNESKLKENFLKTWRRYCNLIGENADEHISTRKRVRVTSSPFPELNRAVDKYVNRADVFPNLFEIKQVCMEANNKYDLKIKLCDLHHCSVDLFCEVGQKLQKNREKVFRQTSGNVMTDRVKIEDDPAINDLDLKKQLKQNRKIGKKRTDQVFSDFVRLQYEQETSAGPTNGDNQSQSDDEENDTETLQKLHRTQMIENKKVKREYLKNTLAKDAKKSKGENKTVISVTLSGGSQELKNKINVSIDGNNIVSKEAMKYPRIVISPIPSSFHSSEKSSSEADEQREYKTKVTPKTDECFKNKSISNNIKENDKPAVGKNEQHFQSRNEKPQCRNEKLQNNKPSEDSKQSSQSRINKPFQSSNERPLHSRSSQSPQKRDYIKKLEYSNKKHKKKIRPDEKTVLGLKEGKNNVDPSTYSSPLNVFAKKLNVSNPFKNIASDCVESSKTSTNHSNTNAHVKKNSLSLKNKHNNNSYESINSKVISQPMKNNSGISNNVIMISDDES